MFGTTLTLALAVHTACSHDALNDQMKKHARDAQGKLSVSARVVPSKQEEQALPRYSFHGERKSPMQSVYKLPIVVAALRQAENGKLDLAQVVHVSEEDMVPAAGHSPLRDKHPKGDDFALLELLRRAIVDSDGTASDVVLRMIGGTKAVQHYLKDQKASGIRVKHTEAQLIDDTPAQYGDWAKADGMVEFLSRLQRGELLNGDNTRMLEGWMLSAQSGNERMRAKLPRGTVADKTGSSGTVDGLTPATNDVGLVAMPDGRHIAVAIFVTDSKANSSTRYAAIADAAADLWNCWAQSEP